MPAIPNKNTTSIKIIANTYILLERYQGMTAFLKNGSFFESISSLVAKPDKPEPNKFSFPNLVIIYMKFGGMLEYWNTGILGLKSE